MMSGSPLCLYGSRRSPGRGEGDDPAFASCMQDPLGAAAPYQWRLAMVLVTHGVACM